MQITINSKEISVKEYQGQRVVTFRDIDTVHQRPADTAKRNFNKNRRHFIQGVDYFVRNSSEAKQELGIIAPSGINLITESGYLMLVKSFTDDLAWEVQRSLVNNYFRAKTSLQLPETSLQNQLTNYVNQFNEAVKQYNTYLAEKQLYSEKYNEACNLVEKYSAIINSLQNLISITRDLAFGGA